MNDQLTVMNEDTEYVHTHIVNYEPTYQVLMDAVDKWRWDGKFVGHLAVYREMVRDSVEANFVGMGLHPRHLTSDVDYAAMIEWEAGEL